MAIRVEYKCIRNGTLEKEACNLTHFIKNNIIVAELRKESGTIRFYNTLSLTKIELEFILTFMHY